MKSYFSDIPEPRASKQVKADRSRRTWTSREESVLIATMKHLAATGWKSDNGFKAGYLTRAREALQREFPKTDILVHPHIHSKITSWKKNYYSLMAILERSGVGFNSDGQYKIDIDDEQWAQVVQRDSNAKYMRNKSWPMLSDWKEIFDKDRAEVERIMDTEHVVGKIYGSKADVEDNSDRDSPMTLEDLFPDEVFPQGVIPEMVDESTSQAAAPTPTLPKKVTRKRKIEDKLDGVLGLMTQIHEDINERLKEISSRIGYEFALSTKRTEVFSQLKGIPGLTVKQQFYVSKKFVKETELMDLFRGLDEYARPAFVLDILDTDGML